MLGNMHIYRLAVHAAVKPLKFACQLLLPSKVFVKDLASKAGHQAKELVENSGLQLTSLTAPRGASSSSKLDAGASKAHTKVETVDEMKDKLFQISKLGWTLGAHVQPRDQEDLSTWKIASLTDGVATLIERKDGHDGSTKEVTIQELMKQWRLYKGKVSELLAGWSFESNLCSPLSSATWMYDIVKGCVHIAVHQQYKQHANVIEHLEVLQHPLSIKVKTPFKAKSLRLVAASTRLDRKAGKDGVCVGMFDIIESELFLLPHFVNPLGRDGEPQKGAWVCPFWAVGACKNEEDANMHLVHELVHVNNITVHVPIMTNKVALQANTELRWVKSSQLTKPARGGARSNQPEQKRQKT